MCHEHSYHHEHHRHRHCRCPCGYPPYMGWHRYRGFPFWITVEEEIKMLEDVKRRLEDGLERIEERLKVLKKE